MDQRRDWIRLKQNIESVISSVATESITEVFESLLPINIVRGRGLLCRSVIRNVLRNSNICEKYASLVRLITFRFPEIGELLLTRLVYLFKKGYCRNELAIVDHSVRFICELTIQATVDEILLLQILKVLLEEHPTDDSIRVVHLILQRAGKHLDSTSKAAMNMAFERLRNLLQDDHVLALSQTRIIDCLRLRCDGKMLRPKQSLSLMDEGERKPILIDLSQKLDLQLNLNNFQVNNTFDEVERSYREAASLVLFDTKHTTTLGQASGELVDMTDAGLVQGKKIIYLAIMSSMSPDEAVHKLFTHLKAENVNKSIIIDMIVEGCAQEKTYSKYFGIIGEKICRLGGLWTPIFVAQFQQKYDTIYQYEGSQLRNIGKLFGHLIAADTLPFGDTLGYIVLTEDKTSSAGRVFIKFLFQEIIEELGIEEVSSVLRDDAMREALWGIFPVTNTRYQDSGHLMFSINYFTAIGLGILTQEMRQVLKDLPSEPRGRKKRKGVGYSDSSSTSRSRSHSWSWTHSRSSSRSRSHTRSRSPSW